MKHLINEEILTAKMSGSHNRGYIQRLQGMLDKEQLSISDFIDTGLIMKRDEYAIKNPTCYLHRKCSDVIRYVGNHYIQMLTDGSYLLKYEPSEKGKRSKNLKIIEGYLWSIVSSYEG